MKGAQSPNSTVTTWAYPPATPPAMYLEVNKAQQANDASVKHMKHMKHI